MRERERRWHGANRTDLIEVRQNILAMLWGWVIQTAVASPLHRISKVQSRQCAMKRIIRSPTET